MARKVHCPLPENLIATAVIQNRAAPPRRERLARTLPRLLVQPDHHALVGHDQQPLGCAQFVRPVGQKFFAKRLNPFTRTSPSSMVTLTPLGTWTGSFPMRDMFDYHTKARTSPPTPSFVNCSAYAGLSCFSRSSETWMALT